LQGWTSLHMLLPLLLLLLLLLLQHMACLQVWRPC
jgi:hypothetical protein